MSRLGSHWTVAGWSFPRVSGDEPLGVERIEIRFLFSPRERG